MTGATQTERIELRFVGEGMSPARLRINDLAEMADAVEDLVQSAVLSTNAALPQDDIHVALTTIHEGSAVYGFTSTKPQVVMPAYFEIAKHVDGDRFDLLAPTVNYALSRIAKVAQKNNCIAELRTSLNARPLAIVRAEVYVPEGAQVMTRTTIYGRVMHAGGKNPNVHVETIQGYRVIFRGDEDKVRELASLLYYTVGIVGVGGFNMLTQQYGPMTILEVLPYRGKPITQAFKELAEAAGPYFADVEADQYVRNLRSEDRED